MNIKFLRTAATAVFISGTASYFAQIPPSIIMSPSSHTVCEGNTVSFPVTATGTGLTYQWRKGAVNILNSSTISGANSATLLISAASPTDASNNYNVVVSGNTAPSATSSNVSLIVNTAPALITAPCSETVCEGNAVNFTVTATGTDLTYQWRKGTVNIINGGNISGATSATLMISAASLTNASNNYNVIVSGACPPIVGSAYISLVVKTAPVITGISPSQTVCEGSAASFSVSANGTDLTYQWRKGTVNLSNGGTISGATSAVLMISSTSFTDASNNYNVIVSGACAPAVTSSNTSLIINMAPAIVIAPGSQTVCAGNAVAFPVTATGTGLTYQWRRGTVNLMNGGTISGVNSATLMISAASFTDASNNYNVVISGDCPPVIGSTYVSLTVSGSPTITTSPSSQTVCAGSPVSFSVSATGAGLTYQWRNGTVNLVDGGTISGATTATLLISAASATDASNNYNVIVSGGCAPSATSSNASLVVNTSPVIISAPCGHCGKTACVGNSVSFAITATGSGLTYQWRKGTVNLVNGGTISGVNTATLVISAVSFTDASTNYNVIISGDCAPVIGSAYFTLVVTSPATITSTSPSQTVCAGSAASFSISASGTNLSYQWRNGTINLVNGGNISGATTATLMIGSASFSNASNNYNVVVSGACASTVTSSNMTLVVNSQPTITAVSPSQTVCAGNAVNFSVSATGANLTYQWRNGTVNLVNSGTTSGVNTAMLMISAANFTDASTNYNVIVSGDCPPVVGSTYMSLVVTSPATIISTSSSQTVCAGSPVNFSVSANGTGLSYQWRNGTTNLSNGGTISGVNTATLMISAASFTDASNNYNVVVSGACSSTVASSNMTLVVNSQPTITTVSPSQTVCAGSAVNFSVSASGTGLSYQWRNGTVNLSNGGTISGVNTATLMISAASFTDASNNYNVVVSGACSSTVASSHMTLVVNSQPTITAVSPSQTVCAGSAVNFSVSASGTGLSYQWRNGTTNLVNSGTISGVTTATLTISSVSFTDASNNYNVVVSGACSSTVASANMTLVVNSQPTITSVSPSQTVCAGSPVNFSVSASGTGLSYQWRNGTTNLSNGGTISGVNTATLMISATSFTDASNNYNVVVSGACSSTVASSHMTLVVNSQPTITAVSPSQTVCTGSPVNFIVSANGTGLTYQWRNGTVNLSNGGTISGVTTATLMISAVSFTDASNNYNVVVSGACSSTVASPNMTLVVNSQPTITTVSPSQTVCAGSPVNFSVSASGTGLTYQWRNGTTNLSNGGTISGVTTATLMITAASFTDASNNYNVVVSGACSSTVASSNMTLVVNSQPTITTVSPSQTVCAGSPVNFSVSASGTSLSYQWRNGTTNLSNGGAISGVTTATLMISAASFTDASNNYNVVVSGACSSTVASSNMTLVVNSQPTITTVSPSQTVCAGSPVNFSVSATGNGLMYQWRNGTTNLSNGGTISGVTTATLMISAASFTDASNNYNVVVSGACSSTVASSNMTLVVNSQPTITAVSPSQTVCEGSAAIFSVTATGNGLTYQWRNGTTNLANGGTISGATTATLMISAASSTDASNNYNVVVSGACSSTVSSSNMTLVVNSQPTITTVSPSQTVCTGSPVNFSVSASGTGLSYQWRNGTVNLSNGGTVSGVTTATLTISAVSFTDASNNYNVVVSGACSSTVASSNMTLVVNSQPTITTVSPSQTVCAGSPVNFSVSANGTGLSYQWRNGTTNLSNGGTISGVNTATLMISAASFTDASNNYNVVVSGACSSTVSSSNMTLVVNSQSTITAVSPSQTVCEGSAAIFSVTAAGNGLTYQWRNGTTNLVNGGTISGVTTATLMISAASSTDASINYNVVVSGACSSAVTSSNITLVVNTAPAITTAPCSQTVCEGSTAIFSVIATGTGLTYQWRLGTVNLVNGGSISGVNSATLVITAASYTNASNNYNVIVSGVCPPIVASSYISLVISTSPTLTAQVPSQTVCAGNPVTFSVAPAQGLTYQWRVGIINLTNGGTISGATTYALLINPVQTSDASTDYNVVITGMCGASYTSASITLQVNQGAEAKPGSNSPVCTGSVINLSTPEVKGGAYSWFGPDNFASTLQNPEISNGSSETAGIYSLTVSNGNCTSATSTVMVSVTSCSTTEFFIPEGFSPNNDGINDLFVIRGIANYPANKFVIFNRWGNKVFEKDAYLSTWDGSTTEGINVGGNALPVGTYFYVLNLGDGTPSYKGTIYLNR